MIKSTGTKVDVARVQLFEFTFVLHRHGEQEDACESEEEPQDPFSVSSAFVQYFAPFADELGKPL
eukprot:3127907-Rhodomonas_salina.2